MLVVRLERVRLARHSPGDPAALSPRHSHSSSLPSRTEYVVLRILELSASPALGATRFSTHAGGVGIPLPRLVPVSSGRDGRRCDTAFGGRGARWISDIGHGGGSTPAVSSATQSTWWPHVRGRLPGARRRAWWDSLAKAPCSPLARRDRCRSVEAEILVRCWASRWGSPYDTDEPTAPGAAAFRCPGRSRDISSGSGCDTAIAFTGVTPSSADSCCAPTVRVVSGGFRRRGITWRAGCVFRRQAAMPDRGVPESRPGRMVPPRQRRSSWSLPATTCRQYR